MAANLTAIFNLVDNVSSKLDAMADSGSAAVEQWEHAGNAASSAFDSAERGGAKVATACSSVASAASSASSALEKSEEAADGLEGMFATCEQAAGALTDALSETASIQEDLEETIANASGATEDAAEALRELEAAHEEAQAAMENYDQVLMSGTDDLGELEAAAERAMHAAERLAEANGKAADATADLGRESDKAGDAMEDTGKAGISAFEAIGNTLIGAAIAKTLKEAASAAYELTDAFSEAESVIVLATGASGEALDSLSASMSRVYATSKTGSLNDTASAIGEINTRLGYTGQKLEETTSLFLDFTAVTGGQVAGNVRNVTQLMNQWDVGAEHLEETLDKLTYAGQASGIGVDSLTSQLTSNKAILDELGFSLDESIALFSQFELNGTQAASVMTGFRTAINNGTISSLEDLNEIFDQIAKGEISAADAGDIFGGRAGTTIVNAVRNGTFALDGMVSALEQTQGATVKTAETAQTLGQKWEQAGNNIEAAFTSAIEPTLSKASSGLANIANKVGTFLNEHPMVTKAITAVGVGVGVVAVGIAGVAASSLAAIPAVAAFGTALHAAMGPIGWVAAGIAAVTAAVLLLSDAFEDSEAEYRSWTESTREQYDAIQDLTAEYDNLVEAGQGESEQAQYLKWRIDDLTKSFEDGKQTLEDYIKECDTLADSIEDTLASNREAYNEISKDEGTTLALVHRLEELAAQTDKTVGTQEEMKAIIAELNETVPDLALSYEDVAGGAVDFATAIENVVKAQAMMQKYEAAQQGMVDAYVAKTDAAEQLEDALEQQAIAQERYNKAKAAYDASADYHGNYEKHGSAETAELKAAEKALNEYNAEVERFTQLEADADREYNNYLSDLEEFHNAMEEAKQAQEEAAETQMTFKDAVGTALGSVQEDLDTLCSEYDEAYNRARASIDGQIGLFEKMETKTDTTVQQMQDAFASQLEYLARYTENLHKAAEYGLDDGLIASLSDGSTESAGYIDAIIKNIEELGAGSDAAEAFVKDFNASFNEVEQAKNNFAKTVAEMETDFNARMEEIEGRLTDAIGELNQEEDAAAAAQATVEAYTQAILDGADGAAAAARAVSSGVAAAFWSGFNSGAPGYDLSGYVFGVPAHAGGTTDAEDAFVAGDEGPELVIGHRGATVFPADETEKIVQAVSEYSTYNNGNTVVYTAPESTSDADARETGGEAGVKKIVLALEGKGSIEVGGSGGASTEQVVAVLYDYLKPVLAEILSEEIFEEGDGSYEY